MEQIYISGPMKGINESNRTKFYETEVLLKEKGYIPINPFEIVKDDGTFVSAKEKYEYFLRMDIRALTFCDSIYMLKGWEQSNGANIELNVAKAIGLKIIYE